MDKLTLLLNLTLMIFMAGFLLEMGLKLNLAGALSALRNLRFVISSLVWSFVLCPALTVLLTRIIPMPEPYAIGLIFLGLAPCAPFLPLVAEKAGGDMAYVAAFMLLAAVGTVILMPLLVPILVKGFAAGAWTIAKPLVLFIALPLAVGVVVRYNAEAFADRAAPFVKMISMIDTVIMLALVVIIYGKDYISAVGTYAIGAQIVYGIVIAIASYTLAFGLPHSQKSVLALGLTTRNIGAALAPLISAPGTDNRSITMCTLAVPITVLIAAIAAKVLATRSSTSVPVVSEQAR